MYVKTLFGVLKTGLIVSFLVASGQSVAGTFLTTCYNIPGVTAPQISAPKGLYVFIDQTMDLTATMKSTVIELVTAWGDMGERVQITRFSANIKGQYAELMFDEVGNIPPTPDFLFHLRRKDKKTFLACLDNRKNDFQLKLTNTLTTTLKLTDDKLPKTNLLHSLYSFAEQIVADKSITDKTILLVSDGLENSDLFSFHRKGKVKTINARNMLDIVRRNKLIANWHGAKIYLLGLGYISDEKFYLRPKIVKPLKQFWEHYFIEGQGVLQANSIGVPMLLTKSIK